MVKSTLNPQDTLERQNEKLLKINSVLMRRVEQYGDDASVAYQRFERAALLEEQVKAQTKELWRALDLLNESNARLSEANEAAQSARANFVDAIEAISEGFALFDANDVLVLHNSRFCAALPDVRQKLVPGLMFDDFVRALSQSRKLVLTDGQTPAGWANQRLQRHESEHVVFLVPLKDDAYLQVSEHRTARNGTVVLQTDVSEMMRQERLERERLVDDQARLVKATLEQLSTGVCIFDAEGCLQVWNRRAGELLAVALTRFRAGASFPSVFAQFLDGGGDGSLGVVWRWATQGERSKPYMFELRHRRRVIQCVAKETPNGGFSISFNDVTAEREAMDVVAATNVLLEKRVLERTLELEDAVGNAERANASKTRFVAAASHDLLQPLSAAKLYLSALEGAPPEAANEIAGKAQRALGSVESIIAALLDISRLDLAEMKFDITEVDAGPVLDQLADEFRPIAEDKGLALTVVETSAVLRTDPTYFRRILQNLIGNAIRYTEKGRVLVGCRRVGAGVRFEVWDTGPGIDESEQDSIFQEFRRLNVSDASADGMGLGLAIVERACALLHHPLTLRSVVGKGSVFAVTVPRSEPALPFGLSQLNPACGLLNKIVLLKEADPERRQMLAAMLERSGMVVLSAETEREASELVAEMEGDLDLVIYTLPQGGGAAAIARAREVIAKADATPVLLLGGDDTAAMQRVARTHGVQIISQHIKPAELQIVMTEAIERVVLSAQPLTR